MPCFLLIAVLAFPRLVMIWMWLFSTYLERAYHTIWVLPVLGFFFMPVTTIVYAWEVNSGMPTAGINLMWLLLAVVVDLGGIGGGARHRMRGR